MALMLKTPLHQWLLTLIQLLRQPEQGHEWQQNETAARRVRWRANLVGPQVGTSLKRAMRRNLPATRCQQRASIQMINQTVIDLIAAPASRSQMTNSPP